MSKATDSRSGEPSSSSLQSSAHEPASASRLTEQQLQPGPSLSLADESAPALLPPGTKQHPLQPRVAGGRPAPPPRQHAGPGGRHWAGHCCNICAVTTTVTSTTTIVTTVTTISTTTATEERAKASYDAKHASPALRH